MGNERKGAEILVEKAGLRDAYAKRFEMRFEAAKNRLRRSGVDLSKIILVEGDR